MSYLSIGSGDVPALLSGKKTKGYADLWRKFLAENPPYYNAFASPIDALRTGAILENVYFQQCTDDTCIYQAKFTDKELDVFTCSVDFWQGNTIEELKTIWLTDFIDIIRQCDVNEIIKQFKNNYNQLQFQLMCSGLESGFLVFLATKSYDDEENKARIIEPHEIMKFEFPRDEDIISKIRERGKLFQEVKDNFK